VLGLRYYFKPSLKTEGKEIKLKASKYVGFFTKGFVVNFVNPFVFTVWFGYITIAQNKYDDYNDQVLFLTAALIGIFSTDILKAAFAHLLKIFLRIDWLTRIYKIIGIILILSGIGILIRVIFFPIV
jgi:threonine/homoserine/homoserine lactone efflux protein